jgi:beta-phosphoglucomutase-like phosphatase (HAD superfamily)
MIEAVIFDLDGTLVQSEELKAESYARAALELSPDHLTEEAVLERFKAVVGMPRDQLAAVLVERFHLEEKARARMAEFGVSTPVEAFLQIRLRYYDAMLNNHDLIAAHEIPHNVALLHKMRDEGYRIGLATMSYHDQVERILTVLDCHTLFDFVATVEDVKRGKPDPEIYLLVAQHLQTAPAHCLVIEDSPIGVEAGVAAGMRVIAVSTPLTHDGLHGLQSLDARWIVDDPKTLPDVVKQCMAE